MLKKVFKIASCIAVVLAFVGIIPVFAMSSVTTKLPVNMKGEKGSVLIEPIADAPSPEKTLLEIAANEEDSFVFEFDEPNTYTYSIRQVIENPEQDVTYDERTFECRIDIFAEEGALKSVVSIYEKGSKEKLDKLEFENIKEIPPTPAPKPTPKPPADRINTAAFGYEKYAVLSVLGIMAMVIVCLKNRKAEI